MSANLMAENITLDLDAALEAVCRRLPTMSDIAGAFAALARERQRLAIDLSEWVAQTPVDVAAFAAGAPLLANRDLSGLKGCFLDAAEKLLPVMAREFPQIRTDAAILQSKLAERPELAARFMETVLGEDVQGLQTTAAEVGVAAGALSFAVLEIIKSCLRQAARNLEGAADLDLWTKSYCPVCGAAPDFGILKEKQDPSEFLISKAGRLSLHCSLCGSFWRFVRLVCPSCGQKDQQRLEVFRADGQERERIHACLDCRRYLLVIDMVGSREQFHPDLAPLGLVHLDILAQEKGFSPLARTPWNQFS